MMPHLPHGGVASMGGFCVGQLRCGGVQVCGGCGVGSCGVNELQCVGVLVCGSCGV